MLLEDKQSTNLLANDLLGSCIKAVFVWKSEFSEKYIVLNADFVNQATTSSVYYREQKQMYENTLWI